LELGEVLGRDKKALSRSPEIEALSFSALIESLAFFKLF